MIIESNFKPAWWLKSPHLQTIWGSVGRRQQQISLQRERIELPDGDFVDLDWTISASMHKNLPIVLILHGIAGSIKSHYAKTMLQAVTAKGWRGVFMHFRGASDEPNRLPRHYHSGDTYDLNYVANLILEREPQANLMAIGYSLGGNVLLKWLGETQQQNPLKAAVAVSVPFELDKIATHLQQGFARFYQWNLLRDLQVVFKKKHHLINTLIDVELISKCNNFWQFDALVTAPLNGFKNALDYYTQSSSRQYLKAITVPTLILHSSDDPFMTPEIIPTENELSDKIILELSHAGGHVGFVAGKFPGRAEYWAEKRIIEYFASTLD